MKTLNITLKGIKKDVPTVLVDNKPLKLKKNQFGNYCGTYQTENDEASVVVQKYQELSGKLWFLMSILFFVISVFGIFDKPMGKKNTVIDAKYNVKLKENITDFEAFLNFLPTDDKALDVKAEGGEIEEICNLCYEDKVVKKRKKILLITKLLLWVVLVVCAILIIIKRS